MRWVLGPPISALPHKPEAALAGREALGTEAGDITLSQGFA